MDKLRGHIHSDELKYRLIRQWRGKGRFVGMAVENIEVSNNF